MEAADPNAAAGQRALAQKKRYTLDANLLSILALLAAIGAIVYAFIVSKKAVTAANVSAAIKAVPSLAAEVDKAATIVVQGYEQLRRKGKLENEPAYGEVLNAVRGWLPVEVKATNEQIIAAINSAILVASTFTAQINAAKAVAAAPTVAKPNSLSATIYPPPSRP